MKKLASYLGALVIATVFQASCSAMQFQQPVFIGSIAGIYAGGPHTAERWKISKEVVVRKDSMTMGKGSTAIIFKYKDMPSKYDNTKYRKITQMISGNGKSFPVNANGYIGPNHHIYQINGENGIVAYVDIMYNGGIDPDTMCIRGLWKDGKPVTFVGGVYQLASGITEAHFIFKDKEMRVMNDTICIPYNLRSGEFGQKYVRDGEFRFKWDEKANWFGVEQVVY